IRPPACDYNSSRPWLRQARGPTSKAEALSLDMGFATDDVFLGTSPERFGSRAKGRSVEGKFTSPESVPALSSVNREGPCNLFNFVTLLRSRRELMPTSNQAVPCPRSRARLGVRNRSRSDIG